MKIAVLTRFVHDVGGVEAYLKSVLPALAQRGHAVAVWYEFPPLHGGARELVPGVTCRQLLTPCHTDTYQEWSVSKPDVVFLNGLSQPSLEMRLTEGLPTVTFLHGYHGTCISGTKTHMLPAPRPCTRVLGPGCLLQYYPHRCGGMNPLVMLDGYRQQRLRQQLLGRSTFVATLSAHMREEAIAHGVNERRAIHLPAFDPVTAANGHGPAERGGRVAGSASERRWHLAFVGRMERLKGAHVLMGAIERLDAALRTRLKVTFAGDGRDRQHLERAASRLEGVEIAFPGWIDARQRDDLFSRVDLLVVPSVWPEPLGLVGIEAASFGVPALAFDVGGIGDWLEDGVTGLLVRGEPSTGSLAEAITRALGDAARLRDLGARARERALRRTVSVHVDALDTVLRRAVSEYHFDCPLS